MLATTSTFHLEGADNAQIALSEDHLRLLFSRIEADLHHGEVYQRALQHVQQAQHSISQHMLRAVGREAIRLALRQIVRQYRVTPPPMPHACEEVTVEDQSDDQESPNPLSLAAVPASSAALPTEPQTEAIAPQTVLPKPRQNLRPLSAKEKALQEHQAQRQAVLRTIGEQLRKARMARGYSLEQLHQLTWVPVYQLKFLEAGEVNRLPEDVYVQGFVRRIAEKLNLDAKTILAPLVEQTDERDRAVIPSWQHRPPSLQPVHLYVGYAALMTGALGGLIWISNEAANEAQVAAPDPAVQIQPSTTAPLGPDTNTARQASAISAPEMGPPEGF